jgi:quinol monooxygenase YgiN
MRAGLGAGNNVAALNLRHSPLSRQPRNTVVIRTLTARVKPGHIGPLNDLLRRQMPILKDQPGLVYAKLARRLEEDGSEEVILFEEWRDVAAVYEWAGNDLTRPRLLPGTEAHIDDLQVLHFEALDFDLEVSGSSG